MAGSPQPVLSIVDGNNIRSTQAGPLTISIVPPPEPLPMLIGNASGPVNLSRYPGTSAATVFFAPGKGFSASALAAVPAGVHVICCVKDVYSAPGVAAGLSQAAATGREFSVVHHHEPEADMTAAQFVAECAPFARACAGWSNVSFGLKLLRFSDVQPGFDFRPWIPEGLDWAGVDAYDQTGAIQAEDLAAIAVQVSEFAGVPGALTEFMWLRGANDTTGAIRAGRIADAVAVCRKAGFRFAMPWDGLGSKSKQYPNGIPFGPFPLTSPEYGATLALIATQ